MDRWWSDGTETGPRLWQGIFAVVATGCLLGIAQNALVRSGNPKGGLAWSYTAPKLDSLEDIAPTADDSQPGGSHPLPPDMNDPLQIVGSATSGVPDIPDVSRPIQIETSKVKAFFDAKAATIIDAREPAEYAEGHIPGSINMPYEQFATDMQKLEDFDAQGKPIIIYCGGGTCEVSMNLGFSLVSAGKKKVLVYMGGWPEWVSSGYPVAKGATPEGA